MKKILALTLLASLCLFSALGCQKKEAEAPKASGPKKLTVVTTLFPLYDMARTIAGDKAEVVMLLPPGIEPHSFEPKPNDVVRLNRADVVVYTNQFMEPWAVKLLGTLANKPVVVDSSAGVNFRKLGGGADVEHDHDATSGHHESPGDADPHIWLDFANAQIMVDNIAKGLAAKDPADKDYFTSRAEAYKAELKKLDDDFKAGLASCGKKLFLHGGHFAFGYLAARYGLAYRSAQAANPDSEPSPDKLVELVRMMRENGLNVVYTEELLSPATAEMIAKETGGKVLVLNAAHNVTKEDLDKGVSFVSVMRKNLENLRQGLQCR